MRLFAALAASTMLLAATPALAQSAGHDHHAHKVDAKAALAARVDGELRDLNRAFDGDAQLALVTARDEADALELARHDYAHVLAEAVQALWPGTQITFGPATDDGFYYDVMAPAGREPFSPGWLGSAARSGNPGRAAVEGSTYGDTIVPTDTVIPGPSR